MPRDLPLDQQRIKRHNRRLILEAVRREGSLSRAELARAVGLTKSTVSALTQELLEERLLSEGTLRTPGLGRPGLTLELHSEGALALGIELGVERTTVILLDLASQPQGRWEWPEKPETPLPERLVRLAERVGREVEGLGQPLGAGLTVPGVIREDRTLVYAPNFGLGWREERPADDLEALLGMPVVLENDAKASALGETFWGENHSPLLYIVLATGLGTGLVVNGQVYRGRIGAAGELGHWLLGAQRQPNGTSVVEGEVSLRASVLRYQAQGGRVEGFRELMEQAQSGDALAQQTLEHLARQLGHFVANAAVAFDPAVVVLGGLGAEAWPWLEAPLRERLSEVAYVPEHAAMPIRPSAFGHLAPAMGAAALVLQRFLASGGVREEGRPNPSRAPG
ncbi:MAG: ROK family transcriptional regulator [Meiothermus sp.]|nr:ROK family transcriptional regulator [Meiothermus sp.]